jgi:uncharacterized membrane protein YfcA
MVPMLQLATWQRAAERTPFTLVLVVFFAGAFASVFVDGDAQLAIFAPLLAALIAYCVLLPAPHGSNSFTIATMPAVAGFIVDTIGIPGAWASPFLLLALALAVREDLARRNG